jgi:hypothetical protein
MQFSAWSQRKISTNHIPPPVVRGQLYGISVDWSQTGTDFHTNAPLYSRLFFKKLVWIRNDKIVVMPRVLWLWSVF